MPVEIVLIIGMTLVFLALIISWGVVRAMELRLKFRNGGDDGNYHQLKQKIDVVLEENEDIKQELQDIKRLLSNNKDRKEDKYSIDLEDYEKEQIKLDQKNKFNY